MLRSVFLARRVLMERDYGGVSLHFRQVCRHEEIPGEEYPAAKTYSP